MYIPATVVEIQLVEPLKPSKQLMNSERGKTAITRRDLLKTVAGVGATALAAPMINRGRYQIFAGSPVEYSARAVDLMKRATVIDMLGPLAINSQKQAKWFADPDSFTPADLQPYKDSGINVFKDIDGILGGNFKRVLAQIWSV